MSSDLREEQERDWGILYDKIMAVLVQYGEADDGGQKDFLLVDDNLGYTHRIETDKLELLKPGVVKSLQQALSGYSNWEIVVALGDFGGPIISEDEIIDDLRRENLPKDYQTIAYEDSQPYDPFLRALFKSGKDA
jgi:hypothetical protein